MPRRNDKSSLEDFRLSKITFSQFEDSEKYELTGIQLHFSNGKETDFIGTKMAKYRDTRQEIQVDTSKEIKAIQMHIHQHKFEGIRLLADDDEKILHKIWDEKPKG